MVGKFTAVLAKKEAEAYCAQGLHQEAMNLYSGLLATGKSMDPAIEAAIKSQLQGIRQEMQETGAERHRALIPEEIRRIRDGWGDQATENDILVCIQAFFQLGAYGEALWELKKMLRGRDAKRLHITAAAECLARMHIPEQLPEAAEMLTREIGAQAKSAWAALVIMAKHLEARHYHDHALALYRYLIEIPELSVALRPRVDALTARETTCPAPPVPDNSPAAPAAQRRFSFKRLGILFKKSAS